MAKKIIESNPYILLTEEVLKCALKKDLGPKWDLKKFNLKDFTKKGDNYLSLVTSITCIATCNGQEKETFYVAKSNPLLQANSMNENLNEFFTKEGIFLSDVAIKLNHILQEINYPKINFPECLYCNFKGKQEVIIMKNLQKKGYRMFDKEKEIDVKHSELVVKELAKLHASSHILKNKLKEKYILDLYPFLKDKWIDAHGENQEFIDGMLKGNITISIKFLDKFSGYKKQQEYLKSLRENIKDIFCKLIQDTSETMRVICHGDCWTNNLVFR